jgi:hypothetical protein
LNTEIPNRIHDMEQQDEKDIQYVSDHYHRAVPVYYIG